MFVNKKKTMLIVGPLPPPFGGATVSFQMFLKYLQKKSTFTLRHFDLSPRADKTNTLADHRRFLKLPTEMIRAFLQIPFSSAVVVFGSRRFCFTIGLGFMIGAWIFGKWRCLRFFGGNPRQFLKKRPKAVCALLETILKLANRIVVQTEMGAAAFPPHLQSRLRVVPGYRARQILKLKHKHKLDSSTRVRFVYSGLVINSKGIDVLLSAFGLLLSHSERCSECELHAYGTSTVELERKMKATRNVFYHGHVPNARLLEDLPQFDIFVFPTLHNSEGHPGSLIEALMAGMPVISSEQPGIREVLGEGKHGVLVTPGDCESLFQAMLKLTKDRQLRKRLSAAAYSRSFDFDADVVLPQLWKAVLPNSNRKKTAVFQQ